MALIIILILIIIIIIIIFCGAGGIPPNALQPTEVYCAKPRFSSPVHLQRSSTSDGVRDLY
jgi:hypothetical protein